MNIIMSSVISMVGLALFFASVLVVANKKLKVEEDPKVKRVEELLPGLNCAVCGFPNCQMAAQAIVKGDASATTCPVGGEEASALIGEFLGVEVGKVSKKIALVHCGADRHQRKIKAKYQGIKTCAAADILFWGGLECKFGCLGFGDCVISCPFDAIIMVGGLAKIDPLKCTGCGKCIKACPRNIIDLGPFDEKETAFVACNSQDKGAAVKKICPVGCTACNICQKLSEGVFEIKDNLAQVNYKKATQKTDWETIIKKCPMHTIQKIPNDNG